MPETENKQIKPRNLRKEEKKMVIQAFLDIIKNIQINNKPFITNVTTKMISLNPQITVEEIQRTIGVNDKTKLDFIRQLYIRSGSKILKELFPNDNILNIPVLSFEENGQAIKLNF